jgi:hypothetical protein
MNKLEEIKNQLASRLEKQSQSNINTGTIKESKKDIDKSTLVIEKKIDKKKVISVSKRVPQGALKLSVSLYDFDINCLDKIKDYMRKNGVRKLSDSEALRLACRAVETNTNFIGIYETMQREDGRKNRA